MEVLSGVKNNFFYTKIFKMTSHLAILSPKICFICLISFFMKKIFLTTISWREMENRKLFYSSSGCDGSGLAGCEMFFGFGNIPLLIKKGGFYKKMIRIFCKVDNFIRIRLIIYNICNVSYFLSWRYYGDLLCKIT